MRELRMVIRSLAVVAGVVFVLTIGVSCRPSSPIEVTLGGFAERGRDRPQRVRVHNVGPWTQSGRYVVVASSLESRYSVVFVLTSTSPVETSVTTFCGTCEGVRVSEVPGCPCSPPFVFVTGYSPEGSSAKTD